MSDSQQVLFLLNDRNYLKYSGTTWAMIVASQRLGYQVFVTDITHLQASGTSNLFAEAIAVADQSELASGSGPNASGTHVRSGEIHPLAPEDAELVNLADVAAIFVRTTPGKDIGRAWGHRLALEIMRLAADAGVSVINDPAGLQKASSKLYTIYLPAEHVPRTKVCHSFTSVEDFVQGLGAPFVIKPLLGSQGRDVFFFDHARSPNLRQVVENLGATGYLVVQEYLEEASEGDIRVLTLDDQLVGAGEPIGVRRQPAQGEQRSNVSLGGTVSVVSLTPRQADICQQLAAILCKDGIRFAGLDLIGEKVVEVNVFSPSGLQVLDAAPHGPCSTQVVSTLLNRSST